MNRLLQRLGFRREGTHPPDDVEDRHAEEIRRRQDEAIERIAEIYGVSAEMIRRRVEEDSHGHGERS